MTGEMALVLETKDLQGKATVSFPFTDCHYLDVGIAATRSIGTFWNGSCIQFTDDRHRPELAWIGTETNEFGTDEFMKWCEVVGTEPYLCLNFGTGTLAEG